MSAKKDITIRFCFTKWDGEPVEISKYSEEELADIRKCLWFSLEPDLSNEPKAKIMGVQMIYDGITPVEGELEGYLINRKREYPLDGYPTPVVRFLLDRAMDEEEFRQYIFYSSFMVRTKITVDNNEEIFFAEDHNGYTQVFSSKQRDQYVNFLQFHGAYSGKIFHFPDGMPEEGYDIPAKEFALKPTSKSKS